MTTELFPVEGALARATGTSRRRATWAIAATTIAAAAAALALCDVPVLAAIVSDELAENDDAGPRTPIPDVAVVDQDGRERRFYTDLVQDKVVVIAYMFTSCRGVCSPQGKRLQELQDALGDRLGREVSLISISMDPAYDTAPRLRAWSERFGRRPGWTLVTGKKATLDRLSTALVGAPVERGTHSPALVIAHFDTGVYERTFGLAPVEQLIERIDDVVATSRRRR